MQSIVIFILLFLSLFIPSYSQSVFSIKTIANPWQKIESPTYPVLQNLYFLSTTEGWIVGDLGTVLHTTNGGEHWNKIQTGITTTFRSVFFSDDTIGYVGGDGILLRTKDGGFSWDSIMIDFDIYDIYFKPVLKNMGYAVGSKGKILSTSDYGDTWAETNTGNQTLNRIAFSNPNTGWVTGSVFTTGSGTWGNYHGNSTTFPLVQGSMSITQNSGVTWSWHSSGYLLTDIQFVDPNTGFITENRMVTYHMESTHAPGEYGVPDHGEFNFTYDVIHYLFKTMDGGNTFTYPIIYTENSVSSVNPVYISFPSANIGYAYTPDKSVIYKTNDGGLNWSTKTTGFDSILIKKIHFATISDGWLVGSLISNELGLGIILVTHDGGISWDKQSPNDGFSTTAPLHSISFSPDGTGMIAGGGDTPVQYKSTDNGLSWYLVSALGSIGDSLVTLNQNTAYIADSYLYVTQNGGDNWDLIQSNLDYTGYGISGIVFSNATTMWSRGYYIYYVIGMHGSYAIFYYPRIFKSHDFGNTWIGSYSGSSVSYIISSIDFLNDSTGWATLFYSLSPISYDIGQFIIHTRDGGISWENQYLPETSANMYFTDVHFTNESTGFLCDAIGRLLSTFDGGTTWSVWQVATTALNKIHFISIQIGWVVGEKGIIIQTLNGGMTWEYLEPITSSNLNYIAFTPNSTGYIVGDNGTLLKLYANSVGPTIVPKKNWEILD